MGLVAKRSFLVIGIIIVCLCIALGCPAVPARGADQSQPRQTKTNDGADSDIGGEVIAKGKVMEIIKAEKAIDPVSGEPVVNQTVRVKVMNGKYKGRQFITVNYQTGNPVFNIFVEQGDRVVLSLILTKNGEVIEVNILDRLREQYLTFLLSLFILLLLAIGWRQGLKSLAALGLTLVLVGGVLLPGFLRGYPPVPLTIVTAGIATALTMAVIAGFTLKSLAAILGTLGGVGVAGLLALLIGHKAHLTGFGVESAAMLLYIPQNIKLDIQGLLFSGIIVGALGATMDVAISIASAVAEVKKANPRLTMGELVGAGMNVGRDMMGTMTNTLILAYTGSSVPLILIFMAFRESLIKVINLDMIASEIVRSLTGSIGMITVVPLTALVSGFLFAKTRDKREKEAEGGPIAN
jgi:uncharacterized membrane protein